MDCEKYNLFINNIKEYYSIDELKYNPYILMDNIINLTEYSFNKKKYLIDEHNIVYSKIENIFNIDICIKIGFYKNKIIYIYKKN